MSPIRFTCTVCSTTHRQAEHNSVVKALYDYSATSVGELTVKEDDILLVFDTEEEWLLVQSAAEGGKAGFVPANYVETYNEDEESSAPTASQIVIPESVRVLRYIKKIITSLNVHSSLLAPSAHTLILRIGSRMQRPMLTISRPGLCLRWIRKERS